jgi:hypothetical protein
MQQGTCEIPRLLLSLCAIGSRLTMLQLDPKLSILGSAGTQQKKMPLGPVAELGPYISGGEWAGRREITMFWVKLVGGRQTCLILGDHSKIFNGMGGGGLPSSNVATPLNGAM